MDLLLVFWWTVRISERLIKLVSNTIRIGCRRLPAVPESYDLSQKVLCSRHIHFFLNGHGTPFLCTKKASKRQFTDSFLCCGVPEDIPSYASAGTPSPAGVFHAQHRTTELFAVEWNFSAHFIQRTFEHKKRALSNWICILSFFLCLSTGIGLFVLF